MPDASHLDHLGTLDTNAVSDALDFFSLPGVSDDIYEHLIFDDATLHTLAEVETRSAQRTRTMNGVPKADAMTGWRIGFGTSPRWLRSRGRRTPSPAAAACLQDRAT